MKTEEKIKNLISFCDFFPKVLQRVGINDYDMKLNDEEFASGIAGITECYLYVFGFFALTFLMATILFFLLGEESAMIGILFF